MVTKVSPTAPFLLAPGSAAALLRPGEAQLLGAVQSLAPSRGSEAGVQKNPGAGGGGGKPNRVRSKTNMSEV